MTNPYVHGLYIGSENVALQQSNSDTVNKQVHYEMIKLVTCKILKETSWYRNINVSAARCISYVNDVL